MKKIVCLVLLLAIQPSSTFCKELTRSKPRGSTFAAVVSGLTGIFVGTTGCLVLITAELSATLCYLVPSLASGAGFAGIITKCGTVYPSESVWNNLEPMQKCAALCCLGVSSVSMFKYIQVQLELRKACIILGRLVDDLTLDIRLH